MSTNFYDARGISTMLRKKTLGAVAHVGENKPVKARIFKTACELFYRQGIHAIGVDTIAAEAGSNKMSLYRSFGSKDELVAEYLLEQERLHWQWWDDTVARHEGKPRRQLEALFEGYASRAHTSKESFGCALANAAVEIREQDHPARAVILAYKAKIRRRLCELAAAIPAQDPTALGDALTMLLEGSAMSTLTFGCKNSPAGQVDKAAKALIAAYAD